MTPLQTLAAITATREPQTGLKRLTDVKNIGLDSAKEAAEQVAKWLVLLDIANRLRHPHLRAAAIEKLHTENWQAAEKFLRELAK